MLHEFITLYRGAIIARTKEKLTNRPWPLASTSELEFGVPLFLTQLCDTLRAESIGTPHSGTAIGMAAARHGSELLALGFNISQVVHDYGDICQAVTEVAVEQAAPISIEEFHTLNRCLDTAIAEAVTEHARITAASRSTEEIERTGQFAHEIRDMLNTALFAFHALKRGTVSINGSTGAVLGRSLMSLRDFVSSTLTDIRITAKQEHREHVNLAAFLNEIAVAGGLHAEYRGLQFSVEPVDVRLAFTADPQLLGSALMNLLNNAIKYTRPGGRVILRAHREDRCVRIEVEDECGGIPDGTGDPFQPFGNRRGNDRTGLGLGLSIARKAVRAERGDIHIRNMPGKGCVFVIEVPLVEQQRPVPEPVG
jgi:signal transduction histidine kinase